MKKNSNMSAITCSTIWLLGALLIAITIENSAAATAHAPPQERDVSTPVQEMYASVVCGNDGTSNSCLDCVAAGCAWSQARLQNEPQKQQGSLSVCADACVVVGSASNCFVLTNFIGLTSDEVCAIADQTTPPTTLELQVEEEPSRAQEAETPTPTTTPPPTVSPTSPMPTTDACTGFITCENCRNNTQMACAFVAQGFCRSICPELAHVPCYELDGNYTTMTKADVCSAALDKEDYSTNTNLQSGSNIGFGQGGLPQVATNALSAQASAAVSSFRTYSFAHQTGRISVGGGIMGVIIVAVGLLAF